MPAGRPSIYSDELADEVLRQVSAGNSLTEVCRAPEMPSRTTVREWARGSGGASELFSAAYARARECRAEHLAEEVLSIADGTAEDAAALARDAADQVSPDKAAKEYRRVYNEEIQARRLRVDSRKWAAARLDPNRWGDRVSLDHGGQKANPMTVAPPDMTHMSEDERAELKRLNAKALQGGNR